MFKYTDRAYVSVPNSVVGGIHTSPKKLSATAEAVADLCLFACVSMRYRASTTCCGTMPACTWRMVSMVVVMMRSMASWLLNAL